MFGTHKALPGVSEPDLQTLPAYLTLKTRLVVPIGWEPPKFCSNVFFHNNQCVGWHISVNSAV